MATLPDINARRPTPRFGGALQAAPLVDTGEAAIGDAITLAGREISEAFKREEIKRDKAELEARTHRYKTRLLDLEAKMRENRSADVAENPEFYSEQIQRHNELRGEILGEIKSPRVSRMMAERINLGELNFKESLINHAHRETAVYRKQAYEGGISVASDTMASQPYNDSLVDQNRDDIENLTREYAAEEGITGDALKSLLKTNLTTGHLGVIQAAVDDGNYEFAEDYYRQNKKEILGEKQSEVENLLKTAGLRGRSQEAVERYFGGGLTHAEAKAAARKEFVKEPELLDAVINRLEMRYAENQQLLTANQKLAGEAAWRILADGIENNMTATEAYNLISPTLLEDMDGKEALALRDYARQLASGLKIKTDWGRYYEIRQLIRDDYREFQDLNLMRDRHRLADSEFEELVKLQTDTPEVATVQTRTQIMQQGALAAGLDPGKFTDDSTKGENLRNFYRRVDQEAEAFQAQTGKVPTTKDIQEIVDRLSIEVIRETSWNPFSDRPFAMFADEEVTAGTIEIEGLPSDIIDELAEDLRDRNIPVTEDNIIELYRELAR